MEFERNDNVIMKVEHINTGSQVVIVKEFHAFYNQTILSYEGGEVIAQVLTWEGEVDNEYDGPLVFEYDGITTEAPVVDGIAAIEFDAPAGTYTVKTTNLRIQNGEVTFNVD